MDQIVGKTLPSWTKGDGGDIPDYLKKKKSKGSSSDDIY